MKRHLIILLAALLVLPISAICQSLKNSERRHINSKVLELVEDYERYASLYDEESVHHFLSLFKNGNSMVYNDIIASESYTKQIPVDEYISFIRTNSENTLISVKDLKKGEMSYSNGDWNIPVMFKKSLSYIDGNGYLFSAEEWHKTDFDIVMHLSYNEEQDVCKITSITGNIGSDREFPEGRFLIVNDIKDQYGRYNEYFNTLKIDDKPLEFNIFGQAIIPNGEATVDDIDVEVDTVRLNSGFNYDVVSYEFNPRRSRIKLRYGYSPQIFALSGEDSKKISNIGLKSPAMEFGFDIGTAFSVGKNTKMGLYTGLGAQLVTLDISLVQGRQYNYNYTTSYLDENNLWNKKVYEYSITSASESVKYMDFLVPAYFELEHRLGRNLLLSWSLGAKAYFNLAGESDSFDFQVKPGSSSIDINVKYEDNQESKTIHKRFMSSYYYKSTFDCSVFGNIGFDISLIKRKVYFTALFGYEYGLITTYKSNAASYFENDTMVPVIFDGKEHRLVHPMVNGLELSRMGMWISGGLKFKL